MSYNGDALPSISGSQDVYLSNPAAGQVLVYNGTIQKWQNVNAPTGLTAAVSMITSGSLTLTPGTSAQLTKLKATLTGNVTITLASGADNSIFELSFIETVFNGHTVAVGSDTFAFPTYVRYVRVSGSWERVL